LAILDSDAGVLTTTFRHIAIQPRKIGARRTGFGRPSPAYFSTFVLHPELKGKIPTFKESASHRVERVQSYCPVKLDD
jgi:hypothetical protein